MLYNQKFFDRFITLGSRYETSSGNVARQDFIYVEVEPGQGFYTWIDYKIMGFKNLMNLKLSPRSSKLFTSTIAEFNIYFYSGHGISQ